MTRTLAVLARAPVAGRAKTRLIPALGAEGAAALQRACIDVIVARAWPVDDRVLWVTEDDPLWERAREAGWRVRLQPNAGLDARIAAALDEGAARGPTLVIGTDSPDLPAAIVTDALRALTTEPALVHLVPTLDGGFALIGSGVALGDALAAVTWSASTTLHETVDALDAARRRVSLGAYWYDLDEVADLRRLWVHSRCASVGPAPYRPAAVLDVLGPYAASLRFERGAVLADAPDSVR